MDTRVRIFLLLDHKEYYGVEKTLADAAELIRDIPSVTLLNYISKFGVNLYLHENSEETGKIQFNLVSSLLGKCEQVAQRKWAAEINRLAELGHAPIMFWNYSNLLFYGLIFNTFNELPSRDLTGPEAQRVFDAYLIINGIANSKIDLEEEIIKKADDEEKIEEVTIPGFIYQKDYVSSTDFSNQVMRGIAFFQYLENDPKYKTLVQEYYESKHISGYGRMFRNLMVLFYKINIDTNRRNQLLDLAQEFTSAQADPAYIETLCVNAAMATYTADDSFGTLRNHFLFRINDNRFFLLNINFLLDQFYKAQVFSFNAFLKSAGVKGNFLSEKGKNFTEDLYLSSVLDSCFPTYIRFYGTDCINSQKEELCDAYLRMANKVCLIEFKDVLLNATIKNSGDKEQLFAELNKKFIANQDNKPKGVTQLIHAIEDLNTHAAAFDEAMPREGLEIYPVIVYTDAPFGIEGVNKKFKEQFGAALAKLSLSNIIVKEVTFINLNYFELHQEYLNGNIMNIFNLIDAYHQHTSAADYALTPFEVFSRFYSQIHIPQNLGSTSSFKQAIEEIITAE